MLGFLSNIQTVENFIHQLDLRIPNHQIPHTVLRTAFSQHKDNVQSLFSAIWYLYDENIKYMGNEDLFPFILSNAINIQKWDIDNFYESSIAERIFILTKIKMSNDDKIATIRELIHPSPEQPACKLMTDLKNLSICITSLLQSGFTTQDDELFELIIQNYEKIKNELVDRKNALVKLHQNHMPYHSFKALYQNLLSEEFGDSNSTANCFIILHKLDIIKPHTPDTNLSLLQNTMDAVNYGEDVQDQIRVVYNSKLEIELKKMIIYDEILRAYDHSIPQMEEIENLVSAIEYISIELDPARKKACVEWFRSHLTYHSVFSVLSSYKLNPVDNCNIFDEIYSLLEGQEEFSDLPEENEAMRTASSIIALLDLLCANKISVKTHPALYTSQILVTNSTATSFVIKTLRKAGVLFGHNHEYVNAITDLLSQTIFSYRLLVSLTHTIIKHDKLKKKEGDNVQTFEEYSREQNQKYNDNLVLTYGPINKAKSTETVQNILRSIAEYTRKHLNISKAQREATCDIQFIEQINEASDIKMDNIYVEFKSNEGYLLHLENTTKNLTLLLNNANLGHLTLEKEDVRLLGMLLLYLMPRDRNKNPLQGILDEVPHGQQLALSIYTTHCYFNINRFFRGVEPDNDSHRLINSKANININNLLCFIIGCLINDVLNKLPVLTDKSPKKDILLKFMKERNIDGKQLCSMNKEEFKHQVDQCSIPESEKLAMHKAYSIRTYMFPQLAALDRRENLTINDIQRRLANPWVFQTLTSFSVAQNGSRYFNDGTRNTQTKMENPPYYYITGNPEEFEVILPQGLQVKTTKGSGLLIQTCHRSPQLEPMDQYLSDLALHFAYHHHLKNPYKDESAFINLNNITVYRQNHGLAHTFRVMQMIVYVMNYYAHYAKDVDFRNFCQVKSDNETLESLRIAAAFSVTGRESEISHGENYEKAESYRKASATNVYLFCNELIDQNLVQMSDQMKNRIKDVVRYMGNPHFEKDINTETDTNERKIRNYYYRILSMAHKLDLLRCYNAREFQNAMATCIEHSNIGQDQNAALHELYRYSIEHNNAHGNRLSCVLNSNGQWVNCQEPYKPIFAKVSTLFYTLKNRTQLVPRPIISEAPAPNRMLTHFAIERKRSLQQVDENEFRVENSINNVDIPISTVEDIEDDHHIENTNKKLKLITKNL